MGKLPYIIKLPYYIMGKLLSGNTFADRMHNDHLQKTSVVSYLHVVSVYSY